MNDIRLNDDFYDSGRQNFEELLAKGEYESDSETILKGFRVFQKKYVYKNTALQMMLVILGLVSQLFTIFTSEDNSTAVFLSAVCVFLGVYIMLRPRNTRKNLEKSIKELKGTIYSAEIYTDKVKITTVYDPVGEAEKENAAEEASSDENSDEEDNSGEGEEDNEIPATLIHLDNSAVEIVDTEELYVIYIRKVNIFVIPKTAFKPYENMEIKNRLSNIMGVRYKD